VNILPKIDPVSKWNASGLTEPRQRGRPLHASDAQQQQVREQRTAGVSLRGIVKATGLSLQTVRTILDKNAGTDRGTKRQELLRKRMLKAERQRAWRQRRQSIETLPRRLNDALETGAELAKQAREGARRL
jgi:DNA-binding transcriptional MerR regulator